MSALPCPVAPAADRRRSFDWQAGRAAVLIIAPAALPEALRPLLDSFARRAAEFAEQHADVLLLVAADQAATLRVAEARTGITIIDGDPAFLAGSGVPVGEAMVVVTDRNLRIVLNPPPGPAEATVAACLGCMARLPRETPAPVLILPGLLSREMCRALIAHFEDGSSVEGKVAGLDVAGMPRSYVDHAIKNRRDLQVPRDDPLYPLIREALLGRCAPEITKAFQVTVEHIDRVMLARYDTPAGRFCRHRDNASASVAFRQFAISVNLNAEDYDGGDLSFPEFNDQPYRPPTGAGLIFSASLLHEVTPVRCGRRYVLLTFFHDDAAEARRRAYDARILDAYLNGVPGQPAGT